WGHRLEPFWGAKTLEHRETVADPAAPGQGPRAIGPVSALRGGMVGHWAGDVAPQGLDAILFPFPPLCSRGGELPAYAMGNFQATRTTRGSRWPTRALAATLCVLAHGALGQAPPGEAAPATPPQSQSPPSASPPETSATSPPTLAPSPAPTLAPTL